jgi:hypothetical protein
MEPEIAENFLKAMIESLAFTFAPKNRPVAVKTIMRRLQTDQSSAEEGYDDLVRGVLWTESRVGLESVGDNGG